MHVLVIGGNRFVGRLLVWRLLARGDRVTLLNRGTIVDPFGDRVSRLIGDRTVDLERLVGDRRFDAVVDLAAYTGEDGRRAAEVLRGRTRHHVMVSTGQVYLVREGCPHPAREPAPEEYYDGPVMARPADPAELPDWEYGVGKRDCEDALAAASARDGFPATRIRIPMVNGPLDYHRRIESYLWRLVDGGPLLLPDGGHHRVRHVDGGEVARFLAGILLREETFDRAYNLAQEETPTLVELVDACRRLLGSEASIVAVPRERLRQAGIDVKDVSPFDDAWMSFPDPRRAREELGFRHAALDRTLPPIVSAFLTHTPVDRPRQYRVRERELAAASG